jgi:hypothetical protein
MLYTETVAQRTLDLIRELQTDPVFADFNLVGGTALALQIGHRISVDIDLFSGNPFDAFAVAAHLSERYQAESIKTLKNGVFCFIRDIKVDILSHQYPLVNPLFKYDSIRMVSLEDIGAMKLNVITDNGTRLKDFVDMYALLEYIPLKQMLNAYEQKYSEASRHIAIKALNYHDDIQPATIHFTGQPINNQQIKQRLYEATLEPTKVFAGV